MVNSSCPLSNARPNASNLKIKIKWLSYIGLDKIASAIRINASHVMRGVVVIC